MVNHTLLRRVLLLRSQPHISSLRANSAVRCHFTTNSEYLTKGKNDTESVRKGKWLTLPPYTSALSGAVLGKALASINSKSKPSAETTALKWVLRCRPDLPRNLVQKLFRLRQVRRESSHMSSCEEGDGVLGCGLKRVAAKDLMKIGDRVFLPGTVCMLPSEKQKSHCTEEEAKFIRGLELYKDDSIIVVNKPSGMPVQGGISIKRSLDEVAATCLSYDYPEPPRLVHRLDRDSSGILVMGRTQRSTTVLHSIFREKTFAASDDDVTDRRRILQRRYWALVIGSPRRPKGLTTAPLGKVMVDNGKSDRITVFDSGKNMLSQHAVTGYRVIASSRGHTWLELSPLTGRKHQLRVHCAEVLGTPIVGDYKYAWQAHRNWKPLQSCELETNARETVPVSKKLPFGLDLENGSITENHPRLHLHCKQMVLPNVSRSLKNAQVCSDYELSELETLNFDAPLPPYMQKSWDMLSS